METEFSSLNLTMDLVIVFERMHAPQHWLKRVVERRLQHYAHREGIIQPFNIASSHNLADVLTKILPNKKNFSGTTDVQECSNHYNVMLGHIFSKDIQAFINQRLKEGMVKSDALQTYQAYLEKVESEETQPFRGGDGARLQTRES